MDIPKAIKVVSRGIFLFMLSILKYTFSLDEYLYYFEIQSLIINNIFIVYLYF